MDRTVPSTPTLAPQDGSALGRHAFRYRRWIYAPVALLYVGCFWNECENEWVIWPGGAVLVALGASLRLWSVRHMGRSARTKRIHASGLIVSGPYCYVRNPIYIANITASIGFGFFSELLWSLPIVLLYLGWAYNGIVREEERCLAVGFGPRYAEYAAHVRRWLPGGGGVSAGDARPISWSECIYRERDGLAGLAIFTLLLVLKEIVLGPYVKA